jgi:hypothetical protein
LPRLDEGAPDKSTAGRLPAARKAQARSRVSNGRDVLPGVDNRTMIARRFYDVCHALISDQAGLDRCSEARLQLIRRFAAAAVMAEEMEARLARGESIDVAQHAQLSSTLVRLAARIGINRRLKPITPEISTTTSRARSPRGRLRSERACHHSRRSR